MLPAAVELDAVIRRDRRHAVLYAVAEVVFLEAVVHAGQEELFRGRYRESLFVDLNMGFVAVVVVRSGGEFRAARALLESVRDAAGFHALLRWLPVPVGQEGEGEQEHGAEDDRAEQSSDEVFAAGLSIRHLLEGLAGQGFEGRSRR